MTFLGTIMADIVLIKPERFDDDRGYFFESYNRRRFEDAGIHANFVQENQSRSGRGVIRGLHFQKAPHAQGKLVRVTRGAVFDVAVDIRRQSQTFGQWCGVELSEENCLELWVPPGFAHGFLALTEQADIAYKVTEYYSPEHEFCLAWDDPDLAIPWPLETSVRLSARDRNGARLRDLP